jgi:very-short-patch-repair endonuclease
MKPHAPLPAPFSRQPFRRSEALNVGVSPGRLRGADLDHPFHGVLSVAPPATLLARCAAFQTRMSPSGFFSHSTAARIYRAPLPGRLESEDILHVSQTSRASNSAGIRGHQVHLEHGDVVNYRGVRMSSPARTFCDLAPMLSVPDLVAVGDYLIQWRLPLTSPQEISRAAHAYRGRRGLRTMWAALPYLDERSESRRESILRVILVDARIGGFVANYWIHTPAKRYRADLANPELKVAIEYQSNYHGDMKQFREDMTRKSRLRAAGWLVIEVNADDLNDPAELSARIRAEIREWREIAAIRRG